MAASFTRVADLLISPAWGVVRYGQNAAADAILEIAELRRTFVTGNAHKALRPGNRDDGPAQTLDNNRHAVRSWRRLAGLSVVSNVPPPTARATQPKGPPV